MKPSRPTNSSKKPPPPDPAPPAGLATLQRLMAEAVMRPLTARDAMQPRWENGARTADIAAAFIKPNDRLTSFERLEIYNRQYWFRLIDCLHEDYPGLRAVLGSRRFFPFITAYLRRHPSESPLLRDLGRKLVDFLDEEPAWSRPHGALVRDMARLEWAQVVAFDGAARPAASLARLAGAPPEHIHLRLQPCATLLDLAYPVEEIVLRQLRRDNHLRKDASNAVDAPAARSRRNSIASRVRRRRTWLLVHRQENSVYFKRLDRAQFTVLQALDRGASLAAACAALEESPDAADISPQAVQAWFQSWAGLGLLVAA